MNNETTPNENEKIPQVELIHTQDQLNTGPGAYLRQAREAAKMSIADVASQIHLTAKYIQAMENDDYSKAPNRVFVRGYLRSYAKLLNLPIDEVLSAYDKLGLTEPEPEVASEVFVRRKALPLETLTPWVVAIFLFGTVAMLFSWWYTQHNEMNNPLVTSHSKDNLTPSANELKPNTESNKAIDSNQATQTSANPSTATATTNPAPTTNAVVPPQATTPAATVPPQATTAQPQATTAQPQATTAQPQATTAQPPATTTQPNQQTGNNNPAVFPVKGNNNVAQQTAATQPATTSPVPANAANPSPAPTRTQASQAAATTTVVPRKKYRRWWRRKSQNAYTTQTQRMQSRPRLMPSQQYHLSQPFDE